MIDVGFYGLLSIIGLSINYAWRNGWRVTGAQL